MGRRRQAPCGRVHDSSSVRPQLFQGQTSCRDIRAAGIADARPFPAVIGLQHIANSSRVAGLSDRVVQPGRGIDSSLLASSRWQSSLSTTSCHSVGAAVDDWTAILDSSSNIHHPSGQATREGQHEMEIEVRTFASSQPCTAGKLVTRDRRVWRILSSTWTSYDM